MVADKGYNSGGRYKTRIGYAKNPVYDIWVHIIRRCYSNNQQLKQPTYIGCTVSDDWLDFQNFAKWYEYNNIKDFAIDKDILFKGNKIYSSKTCCFVPQELNNLLINTKSDLPIGVTYNKRLKKFISQINKNNKKIHLGCFETIEEAFNIYKIEKEKYIKEIAEKYKCLITNECYQALYNYSVEIE